MQRQLKDSKIFLPNCILIDRDFLQEELEKRFQSKSCDDSLVQMEILREFKNEWLSNIASDEVQNGDREITSLLLNALSEVILSKVCDLSMDNIISSYQLLDAKDEIKEKIPFAILAYGNLGAKELNYTSDLDLVFLYDTQEDNIALSLHRNICVCEFATRLAQRIIYFLSTQLASGILFQVDVRLRPDGNAGLLVRSFSAFRKYLYENAWGWEHRALIKARVVVGSSAFNASFELLRKEVLESPQDLSLLRDEIIAMRKRISKKNRQCANIYELKTMEGGVTDIDFVVQYAILRYIRIYPDLITERSSLKILFKLRDYKLLSEKVLHTLISAYVCYQDLTRKQYLQPNSVESMFEVKEHQAKVKTIWQKCIAS